jgi:hypothetical protein
MANWWDAAPVVDAPKNWWEDAEVVQQPDKPGYVEDSGRSLLSGIRQGVEGTLGMFGDAASLQGKAAGWIAEKLGASPETAQNVSSVARRVSPVPFAPSTDELRTVTNMGIGEAYQPQTVPGEYARTVGQFLPGAVMGAGSIPQRMVGQVLLPALGSETAGQLTKGSAAEPYARIAGGVAGAMVPSLASRLISPLPTSPERQNLVRALQDEGVDLTAGQATGRNALRYAESELGGGAAERFMETQGEQFTSAALRRAGIDARRATPDVIDDAFTRIGQQFDDLAARNRIVTDQQLVQDLRTTLNEYGSLVPESARAPIVRDITADIADAALKRGGVSGETYQSVTSRLARAARGTKDPELGTALRGLREALDDAMERSISANNPADAGAWQEARNQYRNMLVLEKAATGAGENAAAGIISPSALRNATVNQGRRAYARGQGDFAELARAGEGVMKPLPQSGTAPRLAARNLGAGIGTILGASGGAAAGGGLPGAMMGAAAGSMAPYVAGRALLSGPVRSYLSNQAATGLSTGNPIRDAVIAALLANAGQNRLPSVAP